MPQKNEDEKKPDILAKVIVGFAWIVLFSSAALFVLSTAQPEVVDGVTRKISGSKN